MNFGTFFFKKYFNFIKTILPTAASGHENWTKLRTVIE